ncbi:MAG: hypothetical protein P4N60_21395 [Verrucomicrobiae bacterium]|nr:hypothetical protein [Verrucomicrobiae bacterium]
MKILIAALLLAAVSAFAQMPASDLASVKIAAEAGDADAECKLADTYLFRTDTAQAIVWYRKAAMQGHVYAQGKLGNALLWRWRMSTTLKPEARSVIAAEALKWISLAAGQGNQAAQADLAQLFLEGSLVKQDYIEAYKWGELATHNSSFGFGSLNGTYIRDAAVLKMNTAQIEEARKRVAAFVPLSPKKSDIVEPAWVQEIKLASISGKSDERLAIINNRTFGKGDQINLKLGGKPVAVHCLEIREDSAVISIEGVEGTRELKMK